MSKLIFTMISFVFCVNCAKANYKEVDANLDLVNQQNTPCEKSLVQSSLCVDLTWKQLQTDDQRGMFELKFYHLENPNLLVEPPQTLGVTLWMPSMGHGSAPVTIEKLSDGHYLVSDVYFVMSGDWDIRVQQKQGKTVLDQAIFPYVAP
jgi:hypothetical protein